jgi:hypothetical protein
MLHSELIDFKKNLRWWFYLCLLGRHALGLFGSSSLPRWRRRKLGARAGVTWGDSGWQIPRAPALGCHGQRRQRESATAGWESESTRAHGGDRRKQREAELNCGPCRSWARHTGCGHIWDGRGGWRGRGDGEVEAATAQHPGRQHQGRR